MDKAKTNLCAASNVVVTQTINTFLSVKTHSQFIDLVSGWFKDNIKDKEDIKSSTMGFITIDHVYEI